MIKSDRWIRNRSFHYGMIEPFVPEQMREKDGKKIISYGTSSYGYDARCAGEFKLYPMAQTKDVALDPLNFDSNPGTTFVGDVCRVPPHCFVLCHSVEYFRIPENVLCIVNGKSTYARSGIQNLTTPLEPGWEGQITIELFNCMPFPVRVYADQGIVQVHFFESDEPCVTSYADRNGKYQGQMGITYSMG